MENPGKPTEQSLLSGNSVGMIFLVGAGSGSLLTGLTGSSSFMASMCFISFLLHIVSDSGAEGPSLKMLWSFRANYPYNIMAVLQLKEEEKALSLKPRPRAGGLRNSTLLQEGNGRAGEVGAWPILAGCSVVLQAWWRTSCWTWDGDSGHLGTTVRGVEG